MKKYQSIKWLLFVFFSNNYLIAADIDSSTSSSTTTASATLSVLPKKLAAQELSLDAVMEQVRVLNKLIATDIEEQLALGFEQLNPQDLQKQALATIRRLKGADSLAKFLDLFNINIFCIEWQRAVTKELHDDLIARLAHETVQYFDRVFSSKGKAHNPESIEALIVAKTNKIPSLKLALFLKKPVEFSKTIRPYGFTRGAGFLDSLHIAKGAEKRRRTIAKQMEIIECNREYISIILDRKPSADSSYAPLSVEHFEKNPYWKQEAGEQADSTEAKWYRSDRYVLTALSFGSARAENVAVQRISSLKAEHHRLARYFADAASYKSAPMIEAINKFAHLLYARLLDIPAREWALKFKSHSPSFLLLLAQIECQSGNSEEAIGFAKGYLASRAKEKVDADEPAINFAYYLLAKINFKLNDYNQALKYAAQSVHYETPILFAKIYDAQGNYRLRNEVLKKILVKDVKEFSHEGDLNSFIAAANLYIKIGSIPELEPSDLLAKLNALNENLDQLQVPKFVAPVKPWEPATIAVPPLFRAKFAQLHVVNLLNDLRGTMSFMQTSTDITLLPQTKSLRMLLSYFRHNDSNGIFALGHLTNFLPHFADTIHFIQGFESALTVFESENPRMKRKLISFLIRHNRFKEAEAELDIFIRQIQEKNLHSKDWLRKAYRQKGEILYLQSCFLTASVYLLEAAQLGCIHSRYGIGQILRKLGNIKGFEDSMTLAAGKGVGDAAYDLGMHFLAEKNGHLAIKWFKKAEALGIRQAALGLALSYKMGNEPALAEIALKRAVSYGVAAPHDLANEADGEQISDEDRLSDGSQTPDESFSPRSADDKTDGENLGLVPHAQPSSDVTDQHEERLHDAELAHVEQGDAHGKKREDKWKQITRRFLAKKNKREQKVCSLKAKRKKRDFRDVEVSMTKTARDQIDEKNLLKIQWLVSNLAMGRYHAGHFENLTGDLSGHCSMRINRSDRLVFRLPDGKEPTGATRVEIISVSGHYHDIKKREKLEAFEWPVQIVEPPEALPCS